MLKRILHSERVSENGNRSGRLWTELLGILIFSLTFVVLPPVRLEAQAQAPSPTAQASSQAAVYGSGIQSPLQFAGESAPVNQVSFRVGTSLLYDDNVVAEGSHGVGDEALSLDTQLGVTRQTEHLTVSIKYMPFFLFYRKIDQYDRLNHSGDLNLDYKLTSRFSLGLHEGISYENGNYATITEPQILSGPSSPTDLNQMIIPYTARTLENWGWLNLRYATSRRTSIILSGIYDRRKFGQQIEGQSLYNGNGISGSLTFEYRMSAHTNFGILFLHQDNTYQGGEIVGGRLRTQVESALFSVGSRLSPTVSVSVFAGPQYVRLIDQVSPAASLAANFQASGGGSITKQVRNTAFDISFLRSVSDGAGLYTSAINTSATVGVRRRLVGLWEAGCEAGAIRMDNSLFQLAQGRTDGLTGRIDVNRPLLHGSVFHISYSTWHQ